MIGDIIIYQNNGIIGNLISKISNTKYVHAALFLSNMYIIESTWKGIKISKFKDSDKLEIFSLDISNEDRQKVSDAALAKVDTKYDYRLLFGKFLEVFFPCTNTKFFDESKKYICSEFIVEIFRQAIDLDLCRGKNNPSPDQLRKCLINMDNVVKYDWKIKR